MIRDVLETNYPNLFLILETNFPNLFLILETNYPNWFLILETNYPNLFLILETIFLRSTSGRAIMPLWGWLRPDIVFHCHDKLKKIRG